jgi:hypothetical protein
MTTLCTSCQNKKPSHLGGFACQGMVQGARCTSTTMSMNFKLCDSCAGNMSQCQWCLAPLNGTGTATHTSAPKIPFVAVVDSDNGKTFKGLAVGEQIHIELEEDTWGGAEWDIKSCGAGMTRQIGSSFTNNPNNYQFGMRKFIIDIRSGASGKTGDIELHEVQRNFGYSYWGHQQQSGAIAGGQTFKVSIAVK